MTRGAETSQRVIVVGGGFAGLSIAARLAQSAVPVTLLEGAELGFEASTRNQGWLHSGGIFARDQIEMARLCLASLQQTMQFCPDCLEPHQEGMLYLFSKADTRLGPWRESWRKAGIEAIEIPAKDAIAELDGINREQVQHAFRLPDRAIRPHVLLDHLAAAAENAGAEIRVQTPVSRLLTADEAVHGVVTGDGEEIHARLVILATGALGSGQWSELGPPETGEQTEYTRVVLKTHLTSLQPQITHVPFCVVDRAGFNHMPHERTSVFGSDHWLVVSDPHDQAAQPEEIERIWREVDRFFPSAKRETFQQVKEWSGTTVQAMHVEQVEPGIAPLPTIIDHERESPRFSNLLSVYPGRATLWAQLAEQTRERALTMLGKSHAAAATPPWLHE
ncbi:Anaerobic glycerol-3-phosphate dehydrogenase subunit A [Maioricimonas rarisocia]|uniref:Anaerobic glycerol-3-phosphate dehydrogenase subunit A n=1 Tax=Maioricimonas rarisocia TaxID=2528026 RepID=A0A517ZCK7_9PLAN|nr:FAD-dependent oxidoreductase [Maioricimonas rarisocia]QDU40199.1 Anaerobic glycerol-3-phosphate dehydrogenase subunit A [Maioricimonas rarisocia]